MKKIAHLAILAAVLLSLNGCGFIDRKMASITGDLSEFCHRGVVYGQSTSGVTPVLKPGTNVPYTCQEIGIN